LINAIFGVISDTVIGMTQVVVDLFEALVGIFYDSTAGDITLLGTLALIGAGVGLVYWAFDTVRGLFNVR
jgi:hypothetical protein